MSSITLSMIVKNEEKYLEGCLESVKEVVEEIVIVDTGSTDRTIEIAKKYGAKIYSYAWQNDFSEARNFALSKSTCDWILYLDADERLEMNSIKEVKKLTSSKNNTAFYCTIKSVDKENGRDNSILYPRLFSNDNRIKFTGKVHEQIIPSIKEYNINLRHSNVEIIHLGYNISLEDKKQKAKRNLNLLLEEYKENKSAYYEYHLGVTYQILEDDDNAIKYFELACAGNELIKNLRAQSYSSLALIYQNQHNIEEAEKHIKKSLQLDNQQSFANLLASKIHFRKGDYNLAAEECRHALRLHKKPSGRNVENWQSIFVEPEEIICFGITIALQSNNAENYQSYTRELFKLYVGIYGAKSTMVAMVNKVFAGQSLVSSEVELLIGLINDYNKNVFLLLLENCSDKKSVLHVAEKLNSMCPNDIENKKFLAKTYDAAGDLTNATLIMEDVEKEIDSDPSIYFYLISFYVKQGLLQKLNYPLQQLENKYSHIVEVKTRLDLIKQKLNLVLEKQN